jgi:hypothetical protein
MVRYGMQVSLHCHGRKGIMAASVLQRGQYMRLVLATVWTIGFVMPGVCQTALPAAEPSLIQVKIEAFETHKRADNYGIASFKISNETDRPLNSIELNCWTDGDRTHGTKVLVWPSPHAVPAHESQNFSNVNIGLVKSDSRSECEVAGVD